MAGPLALRASSSLALAQDVGTCDEPLAEAYLDINNVRALVLNNGGMFYRGGLSEIYNVPQSTNGNSIFSAALLVGGLADGKLHITGSKYGNSEFWPGPIDDEGKPPANCSIFDRLYKINSSDLTNYEDHGILTPDLVDWPTGLGAPTKDGAGNVIDLMHLPLADRRNRTVNLEAGERPAIKGNQTIWWVMNDLGNVHDATKGPPMGLKFMAWPMHRIVFTRQ